MSCVDSHGSVRYYTFETITSLYIVSNEGEQNPYLYVIEFEDGFTLLVKPSIFAFSGCYGHGLDDFEKLVTQSKTMSTATLTNESLNVLEYSI